MYAKFIHQVSFFILAIAFIVSNLSVAKGNFVYEGFECKKCLTFDTGRLPASVKMRAEP